MERDDQEIFSTYEKHKYLFVYRPIIASLVNHSRVAADMTPEVLGRVRVLSQGTTSGDITHVYKEGAQSLRSK